MAENKTYYYMKINRDFFDDDTVKYLEEQDRGKDYIILYLKLCLKSLEDDGYLVRYVGSKLIPYDTLAIAKLTSTDEGIVEQAMAIFEDINLIEKHDTGEIFLTQIQEMIGKDTYAARRQRKLRAKRAAESIHAPKNCDNVAENCDNVAENCYNVAAMSQKCNSDVARMSPNIRVRDRDIELEKEQQLDQEAEKKKKSVEEAGAGQNPIFEKLKDAFGQMSVNGTMVQEVEDLLASHGQELLLLALDETILNGGRSIRYTRRVLENWQGKGLRTVGQIKTEKAKTRQPTHQPTKTSNSVFPDLPF